MTRPVEPRSGHDSTHLTALRFLADAGIWPKTVEFMNGFCDVGRRRRRAAETLV
jgi:hypothetical protein